MGRIGILGGTFDPPHIGHLIIAEEVRLALNLTEIWFVPSHEQPHKTTARTPAIDRAKMVECAIESNNTFRLNNIELKRSGPSYTIDTMRQLTKRYSDKNFFFIIGADMVEYLPYWKEVDELIRLVKFVGVSRPGYKVDTTYPIITVDIPDIHLSSTYLRERLMAGQTCRYLIPDCVSTYIKEHRLYED